MIQISHILVLSQPEFVERQVGSIFAGSSRLGSRIGAWLGKSPALPN